MSSQVEDGRRMFQLRQSPLTGESEWIVVEEEMEEDDSKTTEALRWSLSATSYLDMLNDSYRNPLFGWPLRGPSQLTAMFWILARAILDHRVGGEGLVSACESYLPMVKLMRRVLRANGMEKDGEVSEILDSELLGEGLIPTLQQAHDMLLTVNPKSVPYRATTYGQLVESTFLWKLHDLHGNEDIVSDGICLTPVALETLIQVKPQQYALHVNPLFSEMHLLSEPFKIFEFDFWKRPDSHGETEILVTPTADGRVNAVVSWWVLQLDCDGSVFYSTAPNWIVTSGNEGMTKRYGFKINVLYS
ncbi:hypothetical protein HPP92_008724 [Vanilla planifolia]|uniref:Uncharacterized protein n=1 Tax=Vanilla planifolia TaxID=51239 RepID=A0A835RCX4_VANPL|nr:hypothetical protein HPP92_008724 [Vanilla planifolia]